MRAIAILFSGLLAIAGLTPSAYASIWADGPGADQTPVEYSLVGGHGGGHHGGHDVYGGTSWGHGWNNWHHDWNGWHGGSGYAYRGPGNWYHGTYYYPRSYGGLRYYSAPAYGYPVPSPSYYVAPAPIYAQPSPVYIQHAPPTYYYGGSGFNFGLNLNIEH